VNPLACPGAWRDQPGRLTGAQLVPCLLRGVLMLGTGQRRPSWQPGLPPGEVLLDLGHAQ